MQIGLLKSMIIASKGAAGVMGAGLATLAGGLQSHRRELLDGVGIIVGIDRLMSEAPRRHELLRRRHRDAPHRALGELDRAQGDRVPSGGEPFDEATTLDDDHGHGTERTAAAHPRVAVAPTGTDAGGALPDPQDVISGCRTS